MIAPLLIEELCDAWIRRGVTAICFTRSDWNRFRVMLKKPRLKYGRDWRPPTVFLGT